MTGEAWTIGQWTCMAGLKTAQKNDHSGLYSCISTLSNEKTVLKRPTLYRSLRYKLYRRSANHTKALYLLCTGYFCATVSLLPLYYLYKCAISVINICKQYAVYLLLNIWIHSQKHYLMEYDYLRIFLQFSCILK